MKFIALADAGSRGWDILLAAQAAFLARVHLRTARHLWRAHFPDIIFSIRLAFVIALE